MASQDTREERKSRLYGDFVCGQQPRPHSFSSSSSCYYCYQTCIPFVLQEIDVLFSPKVLLIGSDLKTGLLAKSFPFSFRLGFSHEISIETVSNFIMEGLHGIVNVEDQAKRLRVTLYILIRRQFTK